jgi:hypothetical protein
MKTSISESGVINLPKELTERLKGKALYSTLSKKERISNVYIKNQIRKCVLF